MNTLFLAQVLVPLALILWMALAPPRSTSGLCIQFAASVACLWAAALLGIWLVPPWSAPWGFGVGLLAAALLALRRRRPFATALPATPGAWVVAAVFTALGLASAYGIVIALRSRTVPPMVVNLAFPLGPGRYLVVNGGSDFRPTPTSHARCPASPGSATGAGNPMASISCNWMASDCARRVCSLQTRVPIASTAPACWPRAPAGSCSRWTVCPTCRFLRWTASTWRETTSCFAAPRPT